MYHPLPPDKWTRCSCGNPITTKRSDGRRRTYCSWVCVVPGRMLADGDVDEVAVYRLLNGEAVKSTRGERLEAVRTLTEKGNSASRIADLMRTTQRSVTRYRALNRLGVPQ